MDAFRRLVGIMDRLRSPGGCEWDRAQTHETLRQYLLEEAHEVIDAINRRDPEALKEELGDLLLQVLFHARIAAEQGSFSIDDVIESITQKMIRRHPHVFGDAAAGTPDAVSRQWDRIKKTLEKKVYSSAVGGVPRTFPSLLRAAKMTRKAARAGFDWETTDQVLEKVDEELSELRAAIASKEPEAIEHELGDVLFSLVNLARFVHVNPEIALAAANDRFERRFREMERIARQAGCSIETADAATLDSLWERAKKASP